MKDPSQIRVCQSPVVGAVQFQLVTSKGNNANVVLCGEFERENLTIIQLPFISSVKGAPLSGRIRLHKIAAPSFIAAMVELHESEHWPELLTYDGCFCPRLVRGTYDVLSNHALGIAVDMNAAWNALGQQPAAEGATGSMYNIAKIFKSYGWSWGGDWHRPDGMHLEYIGKTPA